MIPAHEDARGGGVTRETRDWPTTAHQCPKQGLVMLRFKGAARDGNSVTCAACDTTLVYRKPAPSGAGGEQGPRTHF